MGASLRKLQAEVACDKPTANAEAVDVFRRLAFEYVAGYRQGGNARLAIYRDAHRPTFVANEFRSMIECVWGNPTGSDGGRATARAPAGARAVSRTRLAGSSPGWQLRFCTVDSSCLAIAKPSVTHLIETATTIRARFPPRVEPPCAEQIDIAAATTRRLNLQVQESATVQRTRIDLLGRALDCSA
jgi:hypothetical protein